MIDAVLVYARMRRKHLECMQGITEIGNGIPGQLLFRPRDAAGAAWAEAVDNEDRVSGGV